MASRNISGRRVEDAPPGDRPTARPRQPKISQSSLYTAAILVVVIGVAILFRGFV